MKLVGNYKELVSCIGDFDLSMLTLPETRQTQSCNILEFEPGKIDYTHTDIFLSNAVNPIKYVMFLTDWELGHIFMYNNNMLSDYFKGDLYQLDSDPTVTYCCANIGYVTSNILEIKLSDGDNV
jgi:hypothetical protein